MLRGNQGFVYNRPMIPLKIAVTNTFNPKLEFYFSWLKRFEPDLEWVVLSHKNNNPNDLDTVDGILFTGGGDIDPVLFDKADPARYSKHVDRSRDEFELKVVPLALSKNVPTLGVCRGLQVVNVALGGTLILDLPSAGYKDHANTNDYQLAHTVTVKPDTFLAEMTGRPILQVNTSHHQAIDKLGEGLMASAFSPDGVIEAAEWTTKAGKPYCCLVQWHPERMTDTPDPLASRAVAESFLNAAREKSLSL